MIVRVKGSVLGNSEWYPLLDAIVVLMEGQTQRHAFDPSQYTELTASGWLRTATGTRANLAEVIRTSAKAASRNSLSDAVTLQIDDRATPNGEVEETIVRIHPLGALTVLVQPLHVIVEDESSDGSFLLWVARLLGRDTLHNAYTSGGFIFRHAGGKGQFTKSARALSYGVWPREGRPIRALKLRALAMLDSDARFPGEFPNSTIANTVAEHVAQVHVLRRRTIENYVPRKYMRRRLADDGLAEAADAFFRLTADQQRHFPIKMGFQSGSPPQPQDLGEFLVDASRDTRERELFRGANEADWALLSSGFGERLASVYSDTSFRCERNEAGQLPQQCITELNQVISSVIRHL